VKGQLPGCCRRKNHALQIGLYIFEVLIVSREVGRRFGKVGHYIRCMEIIIHTLIHGSPLFVACEMLHRDADRSYSKTVMSNMVELLLLGF